MTKIIVLKNEDKNTIIPACRLKSATIEKTSSKEAKVTLLHDDMTTIFYVPMEDEDDLSTLNNLIQQTVANQRDYILNSARHKQERVSINQGQGFIVDEEEVLKEIPED